jgi:hypothetical protein
MRLDPNVITTAVMRAFESRDFARVVALRPQVPERWPEKAFTVYQLMAPAGGADGLLTAVSLASTRAYALAATGKPAEARATLEALRTKIKSLPKATDKKGATVGPDLPTFLEQGLAGRFRSIEARIAIAEGRPNEAIPMLVGTSLPKDAATDELLAALKAASRPEDAALIPAAAPQTSKNSDRRRKLLLRLTDDTLFSPETPRAVIDYEKSRPNILGALVGGALSMGTSLLGGIDRLDGFRSTANPDGTTKVEYVGNTPSALLVQEMTLLRAAELTRAANKTAFEIVERKDYQRTLQMSRGGVPISSTPQGYKTELTIRMLDAATSQRALNAVDVIDGLGPFYYEAKSPKV